MARIPSIFGSLATSEGLQFMIDRRLDMFNVSQWQKYLEWGIPSVSLNYATIIGASRIEAMATVVDRDAPSPLRSRQGLKKLEGEIPAMKEKFKMTEKLYREYLTMQGLPVSDKTKLNYALDMIFNDVKVAGNAPHMMLDYLVLKMLSSAKIQITAAINPQGIVTEEIDLLMPAANKYECIADAWNVPATADPIGDIAKITTDFRQKGIVLRKMLMTYTTFNHMKATVELKKYLYANVKTNVNLIASLARVNEYLIGEDLPAIELVDATMGIESDGVITTSQPWVTGQVTFLPAGPVGTMHNAIPIERVRPVDGISYADYNKVLISKWAENDPWGEYTQCELSAFPGWENIEQCAILDSLTKA